MQRKAKTALQAAKGIAVFLLSLLVLSFGVFCLSCLAPGDPLRSFYGESAERMSLEQRTQARQRLGLDDPLVTQYVRWLCGALRGDFGISYQTKQPVTEVVLKALPNTLALSLSAFVCIFLFALPLGAFCARYENSLADRILCRIGSAVSCIPSFWVALLLMLIFCIGLAWLPSGGAYSAGSGGSLGDRMAHLILPLVTMVLGHLWYYAYLLRNRLLEEFTKDYVLFEKARGLSENRIMYRHCLRGVLPSYFNSMAVSIPHLIGGGYVVEQVFSYPGLGALSFESAKYHDYNTLMFLTLLTGAAVLLAGGLSRMLTVRLEPMLRPKGRGGDANVADEF